MKKIIVVGDDKIGRALVAQIQGRTQIEILLNKSSSIKRIWRLYRRGSLSFCLLFKMAFAELIRKNHSIPTLPIIKSNQDLFRVIQENSIDEVYLFRAGLIISRDILNLGANILNIHCAKIPDYGGLGSIARALRDGAYDQVATLHRVTETIDQGEILATEPYKLDPNLSYRKNEDIAYAAGMRLLLNWLKIESRKN